MPVRPLVLLATGLLTATLLPTLSAGPAGAVARIDPPAAQVVADELVPSSLVLAADPPDVYAGFPTRLGGHLTSGGQPVAGATLLVFRGVAGTAGSPLPSTVTRADGTFTFPDTPPSSGTWQYTVVWPGDATRARVQATAVVVVRPASTTTVQLRLAPSVDARTIVVGTVTLLDADPAVVAGRSIHLRRDAAWLYGTTTDSTGRATFKDVPGDGTHTYTALLMPRESFGQPEASASGTITVTANTSTTLTATAPARGTAGTALTVGGVLATPAAALAGQRVLVLRDGCGPVRWQVSTLTATDGRWSVVDPAPAGGTCTYSASFTGADGLAPARATASSVVALRPADLSLTVTRGTGSTKKLAHVTARLGAWRSNSTVVVTAQTGTGAEVTLATGPVDAAGLLTVTHTPKSTTTYRVRYAGDEWYAAGTASRTS